MSKLKFNGDYLTNQVLTMSKYFDGFMAKNDTKNMFVILKEIRIIHGMMLVKQNQMIKKSSEPQDYYDLSIFNNVVTSTDKLMHDYEEKAYQIVKKEKEIPENKDKEIPENKDKEIPENKEKTESTYLDNNDNSTTLEKKEESKKEESKKMFKSDHSSIVYFSDSTCKHCINFDPIWSKFTDNAKKYKINVIKMDCNKDLDKCHDFNIKEYPTIRLFINDNMTLFEEPRTIDNLMNFIKDIPLNEKIDN